ncbi:hypothetical protein F4779DRAFT_526198 [Xylariaceae sp. FL0662B]|nr:hypothetical protein F4779DRAFT_526198 [Xylariaceae sp. FL0662B]
MPSRLQKPRPRAVPFIHPDDIETGPTYLHAAAAAAATASDVNSRTPKTPRTKFAPTYHRTMDTIDTMNTMNTMNPNGAAPEPRYGHYANASPSLGNTNGNAKISTIRTVPSFEAASDISSLDSPSARNSGFSSSINSNLSGASYISQQSPSHSGSTVRLKPQSPGQDPQLASSPSSPVTPSNATLRAEENMLEPPISLHVPDTTMVEDHSHEGSPQWDGAVGKAGLGKTGRVINKLVSDNEALKRDIQIERLKAEEARQAAKLVEDKMERMVSDYESRLLEANVTKTLLSRKERQVEHLQTAIELEKKRTADAREREQTWRDELEKCRRDTKVQVEEATAQAALMEGRYNAIASHWKDQGGEVKRAMTTLDGRIKSLVGERKKDDEKINILRDLCDQQDGNIRDLKRQKDEIARKFEAYKREQEQALENIKREALEREEEQARTINESKRVLGQLRWALKVKQNVRGAQ